MKVCKECSVSINHGTYCHLCAPHMISTNNVSKEASMKSSKSTLIINDLDLELSALSYGSVSMGTITQEEEYVYGDSEELANSELALLGQHEASYLESRDAVLTNVNEAKAILVDSSISFEGLSDELILEIAMQAKDLSEEPFRYAMTREESVYVKVQRLSSNNNWYNAKDKEGDVLSFVFDLEDVFSMDDNGNIEGFKYLSDRIFVRGNKEAITIMVPAINKIMKGLGFGSTHYQYVKTEAGNWDMLPVEQRFILSTKAFNSESKLDNQAVEEVCAAFNYSFVNGEVVEKRTSWSYENLLELDGIAVVPFEEESVATADNRRYQQGILTGKSVATATMMQDDITKSAITLDKSEEAKANREAKKARLIVTATKIRREEIMTSDIGKITAELIMESKIGEHNTAVVKALYTRLESFSYDTLKEIQKAARTFQKTNGYAFNAQDFNKLQLVIKEKGDKEVAENVSMEVLKTISALNNNERVAISDELAVLVYEAAVKYRNMSSVCNIRDAKIANALKARVQEVKSQVA